MCWPENAPVLSKFPRHRFTSYTTSFSSGTVDRVISPQRIDWNSLCFVGEAKVKSPCSYNEGGIYNQGWCLTLVTLGLPSWLCNFLWIFQWHASSHSCVSIGIPLYITFYLKLIWPIIVMWPLRTRDMTWRDTVDMDLFAEVVMSSHCCCWVIYFSLDVLSLLFWIAWWCRAFNDLWSLEVLACICSLSLFLINFFVHPDVSESFSMFAPSLSSSLSLHDLTVYLLLQFTHDEMTSNPKNS